MVSWKLERKMYHANIKKELISKYAQLFYMTNPTDEQLEILDSREKVITVTFITILLLGFTLGCLCSYVFYLFIKGIGLI